MLEPIACSRVPEYMRGPPGSPCVCAGSFLSRVPVLPVRSAAPETSPGRNGRVALIADSIALRVGIFSPWAAVGRASIQPGSADALHAAAHSSEAIVVALSCAHAE